MRRSGTRAVVAAIALAALMPATTTGCFGRFALLRKVHHFNATLSSDRWVRWFGFLVMNFFPVYGAAAVIDLVFANSVEFWGGGNPFAAAERTTRYAWGPNGEMVQVTAVEPGMIEVRVVDRTGPERVLRVVQEVESIAAYDEEGRLVARVGDVAGVPALLEAGR